MNIVGCILFVIAGIIVIKVSGVTKKQGLSDYSKCNTAIGKVTHTEDSCGDRWDDLAFNFCHNLITNLYSTLQTFTDCITPIFMRR